MSALGKESGVPDRSQGRSEDFGCAMPFGHRRLLGFDFHRERPFAPLSRKIPFWRGSRTSKRGLSDSLRAIHTGLPIPALAR